MNHRRIIVIGKKAAKDRLYLENRRVALNMLDEAKRVAARERANNEEAFAKYRDLLGKPPAPK